MKILMSNNVVEIFKIMKFFCNNITGHPRNLYTLSVDNNYWSLKHLRVVASNKVLMLLAYMILSNSVSNLSAQSCSLCKITHAPRIKDLKANYEEFIFEHQVTRQDAINALLSINQTFFDGPPGSTCKSITCTQNVMKYCFGPQFINDHCWCELGHAKEGLPFIPHICYVGEKQYEASVGSCFFYEEVKDCCCAPALAKQWKHISAGSAITPLPLTFVLLLAILNQIGYNAYEKRNI